MDRDRTTRTGARNPGVERKTARMAVLSHSQCPDAERGQDWAKGSTKGRCKPRRAKGMPGAGFTGAHRGKALPERPALKPYWGKPAVRNFRGDDGDVGIIRSPVRAIVLPDSALREETWARIAADLRVPVSTVQARVRKAQKYLRAKLRRGAR
jgi:hypothetical protein